MIKTKYNPLKSIEIISILDDSLEIDMDNIEAFGEEFKDYIENHMDISKLKFKEGKKPAIFKVNKLNVRAIEELSDMKLGDNALALEAFLLAVELVKFPDGTISKSPRKLSIKIDQDQEEWLEELISAGIPLGSINWIGQKAFQFSVQLDKKKFSSP
jgi:hypothetical protein